MALPKLKTKISVEDYLADEQLSRVRHEYVGGEVFSMAGASDRHHRLCSNLFVWLDTHLENSNCEAFHLDMKLRAAEDVFYYPDVFVTCEEEPTSSYYRETPILIVEVVSVSTRQTDRREKLRAYQQLPSVQEYVIVEQDKMHVELHRRQPNGTWITYFYNDSDTDEDIEFQSVGLNTKLEEIYARVTFPDLPEAFEG